MSDWPSRTDRWGVEQWVIGPGSPLSCATAIAKYAGNPGPISTAWPAANRAILVPFRLPKIVTAYQMVAGCGGTGGGNFDVGIYDRYGTRLVSGGSTAQSLASEVVVNITDTVLGPGVYYMAMSVDGTTNMMSTVANLQLLKMCGVRQATSAFVLPTTVTFETLAAAYAPNMSLWLRSA